jgi:hypothetical protein
MLQAAKRKVTDRDIQKIDKKRIKTFLAATQLFTPQILRHIVIGNGEI